MKKSLNFFLALYCSSIIVGAGLLTLPLASAKVGGLVLLVTIVALGVAMMLLSQRFTTSLYAYLYSVAERRAQAEVAEARRKGQAGQRYESRIAMLIQRIVDERGSRTLADFARDAGFGLAGRVAIILGMVLYVLPANIGYVTYGGQSLSFIADTLLEANPSALLPMGLVGLLLMVVGYNLDRLGRASLMRGTMKKVINMAGAWLVGIAVLGVAQQQSIFEGRSELLTGVNLILFTAAVLVGLFTPVDNLKSATENAGGLSAQHQVNVVVMIVEIVILLITAGLALWLGWRHGVLELNLLATQSGASPLEIGFELAKMIGLIMFALVGTGMLNLCAYPYLFDKSAARNAVRLSSVVKWGTAIPVVLYVLWTLTSLATLRPDELIHLDLNNWYTTMGLSLKFAALDPVGAWLIRFFGFSIALMALTSACNGFTESLADQVAVGLLEGAEADRGRPGWRTRLARLLCGDRENRPLRLVILVVAVAMAFGAQHGLSIDTSQILSVAGIAGGGLLMFILPLFLPPQGKPKSPWSAVSLAVTTCLLLVMLMLISLRPVHDLESALVAGIVCVIAASLVGMTVWLITAEPKPPTDGGQGPAMPEPV